MRAIVCMLAFAGLALAGCPAANGPVNQPAGANQPAPQNPAPQSPEPQDPAPKPDDTDAQKSLRELYLDAVKGHDQANYLYSYEVPGFPGVTCFAIPNNTPDSRRRWFVGREMLQGTELSKVALATRGWADADADGRNALAREWIAAIEAPLLDAQPERFPVDEDGESRFSAPVITQGDDGSLAIEAWQQRVVDYGVAGGRVYFVKGTWNFDAQGAMTAQHSDKLYAR